MTLFNVPAPVGTQNIGAGIQQGALLFGQGIAQGFQQRGVNQRAAAARARLMADMQLLIGAQQNQQQGQQQSAVGRLSQDLKNLRAEQRRLRNEAQGPLSEAQEEDFKNRHEKLERQLQRAREAEERQRQTGGLIAPQANPLMGLQTPQGLQMAMQMGLLGGQQAPTIDQLKAAQAIREGATPGTQRFKDISTGPAPPVSPTQQISQKVLDRINLLQEKARRGTITKPELAELRTSLQRNRPLFGALPGLSQLLTPAERTEQAKQQLKKPLTSTEIKGVDVTVEAILGKSKALPFGSGPGAAVSQKSMEKLWEQTMLETGYSGRSKIAQKQIESRFDRRVKELNKGKGIGVLANQYEWSRAKWKAKQNLRRRPDESIDDFVKRTGL